MAILATLAVRPAGAAPTGPSAEGTPAVAEAQTRFRRALELYEEGNLDGARAELRRAYETSPNYKVLYNLAQVEFELHDYPAALTSFEQYLSQGGDKIPEARRAQVQKDLEKLRARVAQVKVTVSVAGAQVLVDDVAAGTAPLVAPVMVSAGRRKIVVSLTGYRTETRMVDLGGGDQMSVDFVLQEVPAPAPRTLTRQSEPSPATAVETKPRNRKAVPWVAWGVSGLVAAGAAATGVAALANSRQLQSSRDQLGASRSQLDHLQHQVSGFALASDICTGVAVVGASLSLYLTLSRGYEDGPERSVRLVPGPGWLEMVGAF
jgi:hypothetical protein